MNTTNKLLNDLMKRYGLRSDYAISKFLNCSHSRISHYRNGRATMDDLMAYRIADLLGRDPAELVAKINLDRAKRPEEKAAWRKILKQMGDAAAILAFCSGVCFGVHPGEAVAVTALPGKAPSAGQMHIMLKTSFRAAKKNGATGAP